MIKIISCPLPSACYYPNYISKFVIFIVFLLMHGTLVKFKISTVTIFSLFRHFPIQFSQLLADNCFQSFFRPFCQLCLFRRLAITTILHLLLALSLAFLPLFYVLSPRFICIYQSLFCIFPLRRERLWYFLEPRGYLPTSEQ